MFDTIGRPDRTPGALFSQGRCYYPFQSLNRAAVPGRPRDLWERAVKREVYQVRVLPFVFSVFWWSGPFFALPRREPLRKARPPPPLRPKPVLTSPKPINSTYKTQDDAKAKSPEAESDAKAQEQKKPSLSSVRPSKTTSRKTPPEPSSSRRQGLKLDVDLALVNVTVTDPYNRLVTGLDPDNFRVYEDNVEQEVVTFSSEDVPDLDRRDLRHERQHDQQNRKSPRSRNSVLQNRQSTGRIFSGQL